MSKILTAPDVDCYIRVLGSNNYHNASGCNFDYDEKTCSLLDQIFGLLDSINPTGDNGVKELWITAPRGTLEDFGDYDECLEEGNVESREEFESWWKTDYPDDLEWYSIRAFEDKRTGYRSIVVRNKMVIVQGLHEGHGYCHDISDFAEWLLRGVQNCIDALKNKTYNENVAKNLPARHRTGTIRRRDLWDIFPQERDLFFEKITSEDIRDFVSCMEKQGDDHHTVPGRLLTMTADDFYRFCAMGYSANNYDGTDLTPREQYYKHADGRDDGLRDIDPASPEEFSSWCSHRELRGGHPWEVCRGGNSTHISLYVSHDESGYLLIIAGSSWSRTIESVKFYLALQRAGLPVYMRDGKILAERLLENERIGIVPEGVIPVYCGYLFPDEEVIDFMHLPHENEEEVASKCVWQDVPPVRLVE